MSARDYVQIEAAGNRFALADGFRERAPADPAAVARALAGRVDGLLLLDPAPGGVRMTLYNADGGRAEACGNGLRCIAAVAIEEGHVAGPRVVVQTDAGPREVEVERDGATVVRATAEMGPVALGEPFAFEHEGVRLIVHPVDVGNPHAVALVADAVSAPLGVLGPALERHPRFPDRANVELASPAPPGDERARPALIARVWERGVGETGACGTGACAAACVASARLGIAPPIDVRMPGGVLRVDFETLERVRLSGPVLRSGTIRA